MIYLDYASTTPVLEEVVDSYAKLLKTDFGFGVILGVEVLSRFRIDLSYQLGCRNLYDGTWDLDMKNRNLSLSLAYFLF